jgi:hypothetical protein
MLQVRLVESQWLLVEVRYTLGNIQTDFNCEPYFRTVEIKETIDHTTTATVSAMKTWRN